MNIAKGKCNKPFNNAMVDDAKRVILSFYLASSVSFLCICVCMWLCVYMFMCVCMFTYVCACAYLCISTCVWRGGQKTISAVILRCSPLFFILLLLLYVSVISVCKIVHMSWNMCRCQRIASRSRFFPPRDGAQWSGLHRRHLHLASHLTSSSLTRQAFYALSHSPCRHWIMVKYWRC